MKKIKAIFFDLGGVVLTQSLEARFEVIAEVFKKEKKDIEEIFKKYNKDWTIGKLSVETLAKRLIKEFDIKQSTTQILKNWKKVYQNKTLPNKQLLIKIDNLRKNYDLYLLTNTVDLHHRVNSKRDIFIHFNKVFASHIIGIKKPEQDFYIHVLRELKLKPEECVFVDDIKENIDAARDLGIDGIIFQNNNQLFKEFKKRKIAI